MVGNSEGAGINRHVVRLKPSAIAAMQASIATDGAKEGSNPGLETLPLAAAA